MSVCIVVRERERECVCVCERERESERERDRPSEKFEQTEILAAGFKLTFALFCSPALTQAIK